MKSRVKLLTPWCGALPVWIDQFRERMDASNLVDWWLIQTDVDEMNKRASEVSGIPCRKKEFYDTCDYRPMFGNMFSEILEGEEWWGWCDLDIAVGNLDKLLEPLLDKYDVITTDANYVHGPLTLVRNKSSLNNLYNLWQSRDYLLAFSDREYWNVDENGFNNLRNPSLTRTLKNLSQSVKTRWDDRVWTENQWTIEDGLPSRGCEMKSEDLIEVPTGRELLLYHFTSKIWPLPNRHKDYIGLQLASQGKEHPPESGGEESPQYWSSRVKKCIDNYLPIHYTVLDAPEGDWFNIQRKTASILEKHIPKKSTILDVGCGYGALLEALDMTSISPKKVLGIDYCPEMLQLAKARHGRRSDAVFSNIDATEFTLEDKFDWAVCRGLEGSIKSLRSNADWVRIREMMLKAAPKVLLIDMSCGHRVLTREDYGV